MLTLVSCRVVSAAEDEIPRIVAFSASPTHYGAIFLHLAFKFTPSLSAFLAFFHPFIYLTFHSATKNTLRLFPMID